MATRLKTIFIYFLFTLTLYGQSFPDSVQTRLKSLNNLEKVNYLGKLCWDIRVKDTHTSIICGNYAADLADSLNFLPELAKISNYLGVAYIHYNYNTKEAIPHFHRALEIGLQIGDSAQIGYAYNNLGDAFILIGNTPLALEYAQLSLSYFEAITNPRGISYSYINLGYVYRLNKQFDLAINYFNKAIDIRRGYNDNVSIASSLLEVARTYYAKGDYDSALLYLNESLDMHKKINNKRYMAFCLNDIGDIYYQRGRYGEALDKYNEAMQLNIERAHINGIISNKIGIALVYSKTNRKTLGEKELEEALILSREIGLPTRILDVYEAYAKFYLNVKDFKSATERFNHFITIYDSLFSAQQFETLSEFQNKFEINQRLTKINQNLEIKETEKLYLFLIIILLAIAGSLFFWKYRSHKLVSKQLREINATKDKIFTIISHDLKSPFVSILGYSSMLHKDFDIFTEKEKLDGIREIHNSSQKVFKLLENLLDWSRIQRNKIELNIKRHDAYKIISDNCAFYQMAAASKNITLTCENPGDDYSLLGDDNLINSIIRNLLNNAIKFTPENGAINITAYAKEMDIVFKVTDNGIGISEDILDNLFDQNISTSGTLKESGTGLGLMISKDFIDMMGGKIWAESEVGKGTTFYFSLPKA